MSTEHWQKHEIPGRVIFLEGNGELPKTEVKTAWSSAEIYLLGAQLTHFQRNDQAPLLFLSRLSRFTAGQPIRGGVPVIFPWFGPREGEATHGFARTTTWDLKEILPHPNGAISVRFVLPASVEAAMVPPFSAEILISIGEKLEIDLCVTNNSPKDDFTFENCLHTYFHIGDINAISVTGLKGASYLDKCENYSRKIEHAEHLKIHSETDRIYLDTGEPLEIHDPLLNRKIRIEKSGSRSTVIWNPWVAKAQQMPDLGNDEYLKMLCIESGNVADNRITLPPGKTATLRVAYSTSCL
jgi:glucose-6-phosphate 1-epimerase